ncbi:serine/threonine-protein phosphatase 2A activator-like [Saccoglossus kowalevskii]|uniref:Serine/threonine-protein phosphatase 2A activator n=1 Tax=Saccoglossus kowalevskii TaxID=10224 RepID=A0ABM0GSE3_SACKO|nr:PREDICTED: serine/threonine-protein phosphatase 2A activator-like [Saccoglossus kowalevskii]
MAETHTDETIGMAEKCAAEQLVETKVEPDTGLKKTTENKLPENKEDLGNNEQCIKEQKAGITTEESCTENTSDIDSGTSDTPHKFVTPEKLIKTQMDIPRWEKSQAYSDYIGFVLTLNESVKSKKLTDECEVSETCQKLVEMLNMLDKWIDEIPPIDQPQRFGNKAFRDWFNRMSENVDSLIKPLLPAHYQEAVIELKMYILDGFGNYTRIDYGTGHEMNFAVFLCCLYKLRILNERDNVAVVHKVFTRYLEITRKLQTVYRMEPAGSQGVWGLDDFQFLPYIWGSSQLIDHKRITPKSLPNPDYAESFHKQYILFACIKFILLMKTGPFGEHSNTLWGISGVPHWAKVNSGLIKMYKAECLSKFPIVQHFTFGTLMSIQLAT